jgi:hypothetical protein
MPGSLGFKQTFKASSLRFCYRLSLLYLALYQVLLNAPLGSQTAQELKTQLPSENILRHWVHRPDLLVIVCNNSPHVGGLSWEFGDERRLSPKQSQYSRDSVLGERVAYAALSLASRKNRWGRRKEGRGLG